MSRIRFSGPWLHVAGAGAALLSLSACFGDDNARSAAIDSGGPGMDATAARPVRPAGTPMRALRQKAVSQRRIRR
jgi:hypothetical protein